MKLRVLALDYDGTIAVNDVMDAGVRNVLADARSHKIVVALVTGRRLSDLRRVAGDLHFADAIVAENGAVLHFPGSGYSRTLGPPPSAILLQDLTSRGISHVAGECLVEASAEHAHGALDAIRAGELPLSIAFNRGRLMVLPQAISKATGLREALTILRLSLRSTVGIGDAENDHELLQACEVGLAVGWGSAALRAAADEVVDGSGPPALVPYLQRLIACGRLPAVRTTRRTLLLGHTDEGGPFALGIRGRNVLVAGDAGSGKSWVAGLLAEQLILHGYSVCVIDPEGDYRQLQALPGVVALGGADPLPRPHELFHALQHAESSVVVDLSHVHHSDKLHYTHALLPALATLRRRSGLPHRVILDEAHYFLNGEPAHDLLDLEGNGYTVVTYRASHLPTAVLDATEVVLVTCESDPAEVAALHRLSRSSEPLETWRGMLGGLELGEAAALPATDEAGATLCRIHLGLRVTPHVRHREKYVDVPVPEARAFVFTGTGMPDEPRARTLKEFVVALEVRTAEERCRDEGDPGAVSAIASAVRGRYDLTSAWEIPCGQAAAMM